MKTEAWEAYAEAEVLRRITVRLIEPEEKERWDKLIEKGHYLKNAQLVGRQLRYVAELDGEWVALVGWNTAAYHLKGREEWIGWGVEQRKKRLKFVAQNSRYLILVAAGRYPNLASRVLSLCTKVLSKDCPYGAKAMRSLWEHLLRLTDPRCRRGRHLLASTLTVCALGTLCGARGTRAIADFASYLTQTQLRVLRCYVSV